jgi:nitrogen-specific signal transduction histidine kinase
MQGAAKKAKARADASVLIAIPGVAAQRLAQLIERVAGQDPVFAASTFNRLREAIRRNSPRVILLDDRIVQTDLLAETITEFSARAATILVAPYDRQAEVARLIADGSVDFVPRSGEWLQLAASLVERRLRWGAASKNPTGLPDGRNMGELFRHEINNPLTGILGNAELILAHSDRLPAIDTQRIKTVVELAVRLRETVRRVSNAWENQPHSAKSA